MFYYFRTTDSLPGEYDCTHSGSNVLKVVFYARFYFFCASSLE